MDASCNRSRIAPKLALRLVRDDAKGRRFELDDEFRNFVPKRRSDAIKLETILGNSGDVDLETVGGPTSFSGEALDKGIRAYQRRNGLAVDGWVRPGGPTITKMTPLGVILVQGRA